MIQSEILSRPRHPPLSFKVFTDHYSFFLDTFTRRIRGVSLPHGCRLPISRRLGEKAGPCPAREKNPFFLRSHAVQLARVSPLLETLRLRPQTLHQRYVLRLRNYWIVTKMGGLGGRRRSQRVPRAIRLLFLSWNVPHYLPLPGRPPPSAPKMAGIIPLVYDTIINVRSSGQIFFLPFFSPHTLL